MLPIDYMDPLNAYNFIIMTMSFLVGKEWKKQNVHTHAHPGTHKHTHISMLYETAV